MTAVEVLLVQLRPEDAEAIAYLVDQVRWQRHHDKLSVPPALTRFVQAVATASRADTAVTDPGEWVPTSVVAAALHITSRSVRYRIERGEFESMLVGGRRLVRFPVGKSDGASAARSA